ncbi:MAG: hypothetical protein DME19_13240 [Verrucomicrobia bacterium]|nr:MAG: hypothetical protein DME19_13240 [Verrucomicrobiota bacterium]
MKTKTPKFQFPCCCRPLFRLAVMAILIGLPLELLGALNDGLIAWYPFTGNANDASTNANNGTVVGAQLTTDRNNVPNQAYSFNGTSDYINIGQGVKPIFPLTVTTWIYTTSPANGLQTIFRSGTFNRTGSYSGVMLSYDGRGFLYSHIGSGLYSQASYRNWTTTYPPAVIQPNQWTHVAVVWLGFDNMKFYVNGELQSAHYDCCASGTTIVNSQSDGGIGKRDDPADPSAFVGKLDEIRVYSRELSINEVNTLAIEPTIQPSSVTTNAGATVVFTANSTGPPPLSYQWQFKGTNISGANSNTLTLTNVKPGDSGTYRVVVSNPAATNFADATLTVPVQVICAMPQVFTNGVSFTVNISVAPPGGTSLYRIQDQPPTGWPVTQISSGGSLSGGKPTWVVANDDRSRNMSYVLTPPAGAAGTYHFSGTAIFNSTNTVAITGVRDIYNEVTSVSIRTLSPFGDGLLYVNLTVTGKAGASYYVLVADGLEQPNPWRTNDTVTLTGTSQDWFDAQPVSDNSRRFYKAQAAP